MTPKYILIIFGVIVLLTTVFFSFSSSSSIVLDNVVDAHDTSVIGSIERAFFEPAQHSGGLSQLSALSETDLATLARVCSQWTAQQNSPSDRGKIEKVLTVLERSINGLNGVVMVSAVHETSWAFKLADLCKSTDAMASKEPTDVRRGEAELSHLVESLVALIYGENSASSLESVIALGLEGQETKFAHASFVDVGCGTGKVLAVACGAFDVFDDCRGYDIAVRRVTDGRELLRTVVDELNDNEETREASERIASRVRLGIRDAVADDIAQTVFGNATMVYSYNTAFPTALQEQFARQSAQHMQSGARLIVHAALAWKDFTTGDEPAFRVVGQVKRNDVGLKITGVFILEKI